MHDTSTHTRTTSRRTLLKMAGLSAGAIALPTRAQANYPRGPIKLIVGLPPGGSADVIARSLATGLEHALKQPVIVDNRPGGQFKISTQALQSAPADGHTLLYIYNGYAAVQATQKLFDLDTETVPIARVASTPIMLYVKADSPFKTLGDVVEWAKANPGKLNYGTLGPASLEHLKMAQIEKAAGIRGLPVPYRGGVDMLNAVLTGEVGITINASVFAKSFVPSGKVRALAVLDETRWKEFPDVPTIMQAGVAVPPLNYWGGVVARAGTPAPIVQRLYEALGEAITTPDVLERLRSTANDPALSTSPDDFRKQIRSDVAWMGDAFKLLAPTS